MNDCLSSNDNQIKAVACYDLGEFAKYYQNAKTLLDSKGLKEKLTRLTSDQNNSADVKKEAITCYQKLLMSSYNPNELKPHWSIL